MGLTFEQLGKYVRLVDERNTNLVTESVLGINIDKYFMPSVANVIGTDLSNYKLLRKGRFACNPMHVGRDGRLPVARYTGDDFAIVSPAYFMFEIIDENEIDPEYLMLCFRRPDFDRMCWFRTDASVRGGITWEDICALTIPVPPISEQRKIVHDYQVITDRIELLRKMNENLDKQLMAFFEKSFFDYTDRSDINEQTGLPEGWREKTIADSGLDITDGNYSAKYPKYNEFVSSGIPFIRGTDFVGKFISTKKVLYITPEKHKELRKGHTKAGDLLMSTRGEIGKVVFLPDSLVNANINSQLVRINGNGVLPRSYLAYALFSDKVQKELKSLITGSVQEQLPIGKLEKTHLLFPNQEDIERYCRYADPIMNMILNNSVEIVDLMCLQDILQLRLSIAKGA